MRLLLKILAVLIACALALLVAVLTIFPSPIVEHEFATYGHAVAAGAIEKEWIPTLLPKSSRNIHSIRNLDLKDEVVVFEFGPDFDMFIAAQAKAPARTAKELGFIRNREHFTNASGLIYMPKVALYRDSTTGKLLVNPAARVALYFE